MRWFLIAFFSVFQLAALGQDQFTPLAANPLNGTTMPFRGTDGKLHIVYELVLTNSSMTPATLRKIDVLDAATPSKVLASYAEQDLLTRLRTTSGGEVKTLIIEPDITRLLLVDLALDGASAPPARLEHHFELMGATAPSRSAGTPGPLSYTVAAIDLSQSLPTISAPLAGKHWVVLNGCCGSTAIHRSSNLTVNGSIYYAQRFAIDWMQLNDAGELVHGDPTDVHSYTAYGASVLAVADGTVVSTLNKLEDQKPGTLPDRSTITIENVDGNHVVLDLGGGVFAFYAHLQKGSVTVEPGDKVKRGQVLGKLGNTGNTSGPHLHFHLMQGASVLGSNGIPYVIDGFDLAGHISPADYEAATGVEGNFGKGLLATPSPRHDEFPMDLDIVNFPSKH